jgi:hypothetical protein
MPTIWSEERRVAVGGDSAMAAWERSTGPEPLTIRPDQRGMLIAVVNASGSVNSSKSSAQD